MNLSIFAERLNDLIFDAKISRSDLAKILNCDRSTVNRYLSKSKMPTIELLVKMSDYFKCSIDYLFGFEDNYYIQTFKSPPTFSERLPQLLNYFGITRYRLEKLTGISESTLYYWSRGKTLPSIENIIKIAKALNSSIDFILGRTNI